MRGNAGRKQSKEMIVQLHARMDACTYHSVRWAGAGAGGWNSVREKYCLLAGSWKLVLERCERKILLG
jgi:hypothetical protein